MKSIIINLSFSFLIICLVSCKKYDVNGNLIKNYSELNRAKWLLGEWEKTDSLGTLKEIWETQDDSTFVGQSYYIQNKKDTVHSEQIELMQDKEHLIYRATIQGENNDEPIAFQMIKGEDSLLIFENRKHDYPQKIEYKLKTKNFIITTISGKLKGKINLEEYSMKKK